MFIFEFDAKHGSGQDQLHGSLYFDGLLFHGGETKTGGRFIPNRLGILTG